MSKNKVTNGWKRCGAFKKSQPHAIKAWGPSQTLTSTTFIESCLNTSKKHLLTSKLVSMLECKLTPIPPTSTTQWKVCKRSANLSASLPSAFNCTHQYNHLLLFLQKMTISSIWESVLWGKSLFTNNVLSSCCLSCLSR